MPPSETSDDQSGAFFAPPAVDDQSGAFFAPPDEQTNDFFNPPAEAAAPEGDAPILLGGYEAPPDAGGFMAPPPVPVADGAVEEVDDDDDVEDPTVGGSIVPAEPSPMQKWNEQWAASLLARKDEENSTKGAAVEAANADIAAFQAERERKREMRMAKNRSDEQDKLEAIEADLENDSSWQRVVKMIELNQDSADSALDTGRMKDVMVLLKNDQERATVLSA